MNELATTLETVVGSDQVTNLLLLWVAIETRRAVPLLRELVPALLSLCAHFKLKVRPRAITQPPSE